MRWFIKNNNIGSVVDNVIQVPEVHTAEFAKKTPYQAVPILELHGGGVLTESAAILNYLAAKNGQRAEYPEDPLLAARVHEAQLHHDHLARMFTVTAFRKWLPLAFGAPLTASAVNEEIAKAFEQVRWNFQLLDTILGQHKWIAGDIFTVADYNVICELNQWPILEEAGLLPDTLKLADFANLQRYVNDAKQVPNHDEFVAETVGFVQFLKSKAAANAAAAATS